MELEVVKLDKANIIDANSADDGMRIRQSGIAKVLWQKLDGELPESCIIVNGVDIYKD